MTKFLFITIIVFAVGGMQVRADPCRKNFGGCDEYNGLCWGTGRDTHFCSCKAGFKDGSDAGDSSYCVDVDECREDTELCPENAICENTEGSYKCTCTCGYVMDYTGQHCLDHSEITGLCEVPDRCYPINPFIAFLPISDFNTIYSESYIPDYNRLQFIRYQRNTRRRCKCESGFELNSCGYCVDINECRVRRRPCSGSRTTCVNTEGSYYCECPAGYVLGPCRMRCYRAEDTTIPTICGDRDLEDLKWQGITISTTTPPINLPNWRTCAEGVEPGTTTIERYDTDQDNTRDLILRWTCTADGFNPPFSVLKSVAEGEASWGSWTCWTACKATCWGGVQTRVRECLNGLPGMEGCIGDGSQKRECYKGKKCAFRVRKDVETLSRRERDDLVQAMKKYKEDASVKGFFNAAAAHGWPNQCDGRSCCPHGAKMKFLAWHRTIMLNYEQGLSRYLKDKTLGIPYWNWLRNNRNPPNLVMDKKINGDDNPFANVTVLIDRVGLMRTIQRDDTVSMDPLNDAHDTWKDIALKLIHPATWHEFSETLENAHGGPHVSICSGRSEKCRISLGNLLFAGFEPLFMFHHSQVDRLWAIAQKKMEDAGNTTWTEQTALEPMEDRGDFGRRHMPFGNKSLNAFPIVQAVNTMRDSYYYRELTGIKYDTLENDGFVPSAGVRALPFRKVVEALFVAHYLQSVEENVYVNYYAIFDGFEELTCTQLGDELRLAGTLIQGTPNSYRNSIPRLISLVPVLGTSGLDEDLVVKACYTSNVTCTSRCPEVTSKRIETMPDPALVHYIPNQPIDVYKFMWEEGRRMPNWYINLDAQSQWIFFFGNRVDQIRQVSSGFEWLRCKAQKGKRIDCSANACILPSGIYYLIDNSEEHCKKGLKMLIVSRK